MPKFASREEYEEWKDGKIVESHQFPADSYENTYKPKKSCSGITGFIVAIIIVLSGIFAYLEYFRMDIAWTDTTYTNMSLGFTVELPECIKTKIKP